MDGGINRIERSGPQPAARVRRIERGERDPFTLDEPERREDDDEDDDEHGERAEHDDRDHDERPIAPRGDDENGAHIDLTA